MITNFRIQINLQKFKKTPYGFVPHAFLAASSKNYHLFSGPILTTILPKRLKGTDALTKPAFKANFTDFLFCFDFNLVVFVDSSTFKCKMKCHARVLSEILSINCPYCCIVFIHHTGSKF